MLSVLLPKEENMGPSAWLLSVLLTTVPPSVHRQHETQEEVIARYELISESLAEVTFDAKERPIYSGEYARSKTALMMLAIARFETGFLKRYESEASRDGAWCYGQLHIGKGRTAEGWSGPELLEQREKCWRAMLGVLRRTWRYCGASPELALTAYTAGRCDSLMGRRYSEARVLFANKLIEKHHPPMRDDHWINFGKEDCDG